MTILVTGARGTVGSYFRELGDRFEEPMDLLGRDELDVTDLAQVMNRLDRHRYSTVIHLAAATDVDRCELEPAWAFKLNTVGAWNVALAAERYGADVVHVSTVGIFGGDGARGPFSEVDAPCPANVYARTKLAAEERVRDHTRRAFIIRTAWIMGGGAGDRKFVGKVRSRLLAGEPLKAVTDTVGSPTYARDLVLAIRELLRCKAYGLYHVTNRGVASRFDMACVMKDVLRSRSEITPGVSGDFALPARRPPSEGSVSLALEARGLGGIMRPWEDALRDYLARW